MTDTYTTTLEAMKAKGQVMDVLPILDDDMAQRVLIAWPRITITRTPTSDPMPEGDNTIWHWLWLGIDYNAEELAAVVGFQSKRVRLKVDQLKGNRLIFPDGTISEYAEKVLTAKTHEAIRQMKG